MALKKPINLCCPMYNICFLLSTSKWHNTSSFQSSPKISFSVFTYQTGLEQNTVSTPWRQQPWTWGKSSIWHHSPQDDWISDARPVRREQKTEQKQSFKFFKLFCVFLSMMEKNLLVLQYGTAEKRKKKKQPQPEIPEWTHPLLYKAFSKLNTVHPICWLSSLKLYINRVRRKEKQEIKNVAKCDKSHVALLVSKRKHNHHITCNATFYHFPCR